MEFLHRSRWKSRMRPAMMIILLCFNAHPHAKELATSRNNDAPDFADKSDFFDKMVDKVFDTLVDKLIQGWNNAMHSGSGYNFHENAAEPPWNGISKWREEQRHELHLITDKEEHDYEMLWSKDGTVPSNKDIEAPKRGTVVILLAGRYRGKRVVCLKKMEEKGILLVTGPYELNGVPVRRVSQQFVQPTSTVVDIQKVKGLTLKDLAIFDDESFEDKRDAIEPTNADLFGAYEPKPMDADMKKRNEELDAALMGEIKKVPYLKEYLQDNFYLTEDFFPHKNRF